MESPHRVRRSVRERLAEPGSVVYFSLATAWEISIKWSIGKLKLPEPPARLIPARLARDQLTLLPIELSHALRVATLPLHHPDPFDRLLIAQAKVERVPIVTDDPCFSAYGVTVIRAS